MARAIARDLDYLAARLHARRARLAEAERLDGLCRLRTVPELVGAVFPDADYRDVAAFQRRVLDDLVVELTFVAGSLDGAGRELVTAIQARFQVENIKVVLRGFLNRWPLERVNENLAGLPGALSLDVEDLLGARSLEQFAGLLPTSAARGALEGTLRGSGHPPPIFFLEAAIDRAYLEELLAKTAMVRGEDREVIFPVFDQEACAFQLLLLVRGRFIHGLAPDALSALHVPGSALSSRHFAAIAAAPDLRTAAALAARRAIDGTPAASESDGSSPAMAIAELEAMAWQRYLRLCNRAFRRSHLGLGAVVGYLGVRRVEAANLITLSEGVRSSLAPERLQARLIPRALSVAHA